MRTQTVRGNGEDSMGGSWTTDTIEKKEAGQPLVVPC